MTNRMATITIDGRRHQVDPSKNLLEAALSLGYDLPYFCWHPALGSVGACRQCAVKQFRDEQDKRGRLVMACMTPVTEGAIASISDPEARELRASVIEWLMVNHPHDCPVCDEGGECHLQDMTVMTGHAARRYRFRKRTYRNQDLGPLINHEMNRCIQCYRCVRYYADYAGGHDLQAFGAHDHVYFGRHRDGVLESEFAGNLVEICPTGVFTDRTLKSHYTRKWDLQTAPSVCVHCAVGCNTTPGERYGELRRIRNRYHADINRYFLCDRGRYGYGFVTHERRLRHALLPQGPQQKARAIDRSEAESSLREILDQAQGLIGIGSPRATLEGNFALRSLVGAPNFYRGVAERDATLTDGIVGALGAGPARIASLRDVEACDAALVLGEDVTNTAPLLALALRQSAQRRPREEAQRAGIPSWHDAALRDAVQDQTGPLYIACPHSTKLDDAARRVWRGTPEEIARLGHAVANAIDREAPAVSGRTKEDEELAEEIAQALVHAERPLVVSGYGCSSTEVVRAAAAVASALGRRAERAASERGAWIHLTVPECNSVGLALLGGAPLEHAFAAVAEHRADTVVIIENDLYRRAPAAEVDRFLDAARRVVVVDSIAHETAARAHLVLPAAPFAEADGTLVNDEGRAQRAYRVYPSEGDVRESWRWLTSARDDGRPHWGSHDDVIRALAEEHESFRSLGNTPFPTGFRIAGAKFPRALHRQSGRTAVHAHLNVHEQKPPDDRDSPLSFSMEGYDGQPPAALAAEFWSPGWNSIQALNRFQEEVGGQLLQGDPGVRLIKPATGEGLPPSTPPEPVPENPGEWRVVPLHHVFGSEELSALSPGVAALSPAPYVALGAADAQGLGIAEGGEVEVTLGDRALRLPARFRTDLVPGVIGLPLGLRGLEVLDADRATLRRSAT